MGGGPEVGEASLPEMGRELAAIILRGHAHPSLPQVAFYQVDGLHDGVALRERCLDRSDTLTFTVVNPHLSGRLHVFDVRAGVPVAIHYFPPFDVSPDTDLTSDQTAYLDEIATKISVIHGIENKDGAAVKLPWVFVVQIVSGDERGGWPQTKSSDD